MTKPTAPPTINTGLALRPGDEIVISGTAWDPKDGPLSWNVSLNRGPTLHEAEGDAFECRWLVTSSHITEAALVSVRLSSHRDYHRLANGDDDRVVLQYRVLPPTS